MPSSAPFRIKKVRRAPAQEKVLGFIRDWKVDKDGNSPGYQQIADGLGMSVSTVYTHVLKLVAKGRLKLAEEDRRIMMIGGEYLPPDETE